MKKLIVETTRKTEVVNVTALIEQAAREIGDGVALISVPHTTAALLLCEDDDEMRADLERVAERWLEALEPFRHRRNNNPNAAAHVLSAFGGTQLILSIAGGKLEVGTYQNALLLEMDGPKKRELWVRAIKGG